MQNGPKLPKRLPVTLLLVSFIVGILALAAFAALLPAERFSNNGSVSGAPDGLVEPGGTRVKGHPDSRTKGTPISPQVYAFHRD